MRMPVRALHKDAEAQLGGIVVENNKDKGILGGRRDTELCYLSN